MDIKQCCDLTDAQMEQILALERVCVQADGLENHLFLTNEINFDRTIPTFFMAYEGTALVGFLTFFIPTCEEAEISAVVHPSYRRRHVFTRLDETARRVIAAHQIGRILYSVETKCPSAAQVLKRWGIAEILRSEYRMRLGLERSGDGAPSQPDNGTFSLRRVTADNVGVFLRIAGRAFGNDEGSACDSAIVTSETRIGYMLYRDDEPIGVFSIGLEAKDEPFVYGVAIAESERGKGYGRLLMERARGVAGAYGRTLQLDVDSKNPAALHLYRSMGFETTFQVDYYLRPTC